MMRAVGIDPRLVADGLEAGDAVLKVGILEVGAATAGIPAGDGNNVS